MFFCPLGILYYETFKTLGHIVHITKMYSGWKSKDSVPKLVEKYLDNEIKLDDFVTAELPLEKINEGFELLHGGDW